ELARPWRSILMSELTEAPKIDIETHNQLLELAGDNQELRENLDRVRQQFLRLEYENANWMRVLGGSAQENSGPRLDLIKNISSQLREEVAGSALPKRANERSEEHTSELQSRFDLVCRLLLEQKKASQVLLRQLTS